MLWRIIITLHDSEIVHKYLHCASQQHTLESLAQGANRLNMPHRVSVRVITGAFS